jgi:hypothetical protein
MRRTAVLFIAAMAIVTTSCGEPCSCGEAVSCVDVNADVIDQSGIDVAITGATEAPEDIGGSPQWYLASATGGLWLSGLNPETGSDGAPTQPLNNQALQESDVGADLGINVNDRITPGVSADSAAAEKALECAQQ